MHPFLAAKANTLFKVPKKEGDIFGIEIECNVSKMRDGLWNTEEIGWRAEKDGSLKQNGIEYVICDPVGKKKCLERVSSLRDYIYNKCNSSVLDSQKAGTHIHLNVSDLRGIDILKLLTIYYPLETVLVNKGGVGRSGNLFCLRLRDAPAVAEDIFKTVVTNSWKYVHTDMLRYSAMNFQSLFKYGTLELRFIRTSPDFDNIEVWLDVLSRLKKVACQIEDPWDEIIKISGIGPTEWARSILGEDLFDYFAYDGMDEDIYHDMQLIQLVAHRISRVMKEKN